MRSPEIGQGSRGREVTELGILLQGYSSYLVSIGKSLRTAEEYSRDVRLWSGWFKRSPDFFHEPEWDDWTIHLQQSGLRPSSVKRKRISLKRFFKYLRRRKIVSHDPAKDCESIKLPKELPSWLFLEEVERIIGAAKTARNRALIEVLYSCGLRNEECRSLRLHQLQGNTIQVTGKGSKQRIVKIPAQSMTALEAWLRKRPTETDILFPSNRKRVMGAKTLRRTIAKLVKLAGISKIVTPHTFRHSIATHLAMRKVNVQEIQLFLGHESPETTMRYIHLAQSLVQEAVMKAHPRA